MRLSEAPLITPLSTSLAALIPQLKAKLETTPTGLLDNPFPLLDFKIGYFCESHLTYLLNEIFVDGAYWFESGCPAPVIVDCGSNIGVSILYFKALYPDAKVIGFEPDPTTFALLKDNIHRNMLQDVEIHNVALGAIDGDVDFFVSPSIKGSLLMSVHRERMPGTRINILSRRLSGFLPERVDLVKIDVEGSETEVLSELEHSGALARVRLIHLEYHHHIKPDDNSLSAVLSLFERNGFGYQLKAACEPGLTYPGTFQDIAIFAYKKAASI